MGKAKFLLADFIHSMREKIKKFSKSRRILFAYTERIERFNESRFKSRKVKRRATSSENRKFFIAVVKSALGIEDVDQWKICEIIVGVCWPCKSRKDFGS